MRKSVPPGVIVIALALVVAACSGSGTAPSTAAGGATSSEVGGAASTGSDRPASGSLGPSDSSGSASSAPAGQTSVRIGNFYVDPSLTPGPALDLYDQPVGQAATPILTAVAYGSFSDYVHPRETDGIVRLYVLPTGEDPVANQADGQGIDGYQDDGSHLQETFIMQGEGNGDSCMTTGPICDLGVSYVVEKGDDADGSAGPVAPPPPAGQAELLVTTQVVDVENLREPTDSAAYYFLIDASCDPPLNGDAAQKPGLPYVAGLAGSGSSQAVFATTPGTHQISVVAYGQGDLPTCAALAPKQGQMSVDVTAGQQSLVYIYGTSVTDLHLAVGPIQP